MTLRFGNKIVRLRDPRLGGKILLSTPAAVDAMQRFLPCRDVAQPGRALAWGARGRQFKSARPDHLFPVVLALQAASTYPADGGSHTLQIIGGSVPC